MIGYANGITIETPEDSKPKDVSTDIKQNLDNIPVSLTRQRMGRGAVFLLFVMVLLGAKEFGQPFTVYTSIHDVLMDALTPFNNLINNDPFWRSFFQGISSAMLDLYFLMTIIPWVIKGKTGRFLYTMAFFYAIRGLTQQLILFPFPDGYWWYSPGIPSLVVPYGRASDFFYSGHCGFLMILICENWASGVKWLAKIMIASEFYLIFVLSGYRVHYVSDILTGLVIAHWLFMLMSKHAPAIDANVVKVFQHAMLCINKKANDGKNANTNKENLI
jgi:hypothetical protein